MIELLIATAMMIVITGAAVAMLVSVMHQQPKVTEGADQIGKARNAIERITVDLRQGSAVEPGGSSQGLTLVMPCSTLESGQAGTCTVSYACAPESGASAPYYCTRRIGTGAPKTVVTGLLTNKVFCYFPFVAGTETIAGSGCGAISTEPPKYVGAAVELPASEGEGKTVLEDGSALHNAPGLFG